MRKPLTATGPSCATITARRSGLVSQVGRRATSTRRARNASDTRASGERPLLDWVFTLPFLLVFALILLVFDPLQRIARLFHQRPQEIVAGGLQVAIVWAFRICGTRFEVGRAPETKPHTPYLLIANHQGTFDIPIAGSLLFSNFPKYVAKKQLSRGIPSISYSLRRGDHAIIDRQDREQATKAIHALGARALESGLTS